MLKFFFELGMLRRIKHQGSMLAGVANPESVAEHSQRAAVLAYFLAREEGADPYRCAMIALIHDIPECRIGDQHKVAARYFDVKPGEQQAFEDQITPFPEAAQKDWTAMFDEFNTRSTTDGIIAKDADYIDQALTAREFEVLGHAEMRDWITNVSQAVHTDTATAWIDQIKTANPYAWWHGLKKIKLYP